MGFLREQPETPNPPSFFENVPTSLAPSGDSCSLETPPCRKFVCYMWEGYPKATQRHTRPEF